MKKNAKNIIILIFLNIGIYNVFAQKPTKFYRLNISKDSTLISENSNLIKGKPNKDNGKEFFEVAEALWRKKDNENAKKMFRKIEKSNLNIFNRTKLLNSDIPNDTSQNNYNYGSFTFNYKNRASIYLSKILIEKGKYNKALRYIKSAENKYKMNFNCGTGFMNNSREMKELYALCYEGLNKNEKVINLLLPTIFMSNNNDDILGRALKNKFSENELEIIEKDAINSIIFEKDNYKSDAYISVDNQKERKISYTSGKGFITLFGNSYKLPQPNLKNGETVKKEHFIEIFKKSRLYWNTFY